jgi:hypothetical protein
MQERKPGSQVPGEDVVEDIVGELESEYGECCIPTSVLFPAAREFVFLL